MSGNEIVSELLINHYNSLLKRLRIAASKYGNTQLINEAEDCLQEAFLKLYKEFDNLANDKNLLGWVYIAAYRNMLNSYRLMRGRNTTSIGTFSDDEYSNGIIAKKFDENVVRAIQERETIEDMLELAASCVDSDSYQFLLAYYDPEMNARKIAKKYGTTEEKVYARRKRLVRKIRKTLFHSILTTLGANLYSPITYSVGGDMDDGDNSHSAPSTPNAASSDVSLKLNPKDAETILLLLGLLQPEDVALELVEKCLEVLDDGSAAPAPDAVVDRFRQRAACQASTV